MDVFNELSLLDELIVDEVTPTVAHAEALRKVAAEIERGDLYRDESRFELEQQLRQARSDHRDLYVDCERLRARVAGLEQSPGIEVLLSSLDESIAQREVTPGRPEDGPYPATVGECADEIVDWLGRTEPYAHGLAEAVAARLASVPSGEES